MRRIVYYNASTPSCPIEAITYLNASGITDLAIRDNYCKFVQELKTNGVYSLIDVLYPDLGSNASQNKLNAINPIDSDGAFRRTFGGGMTFSPITGTKGNGTNAFFDTHYNTSNMSELTGGGFLINILTENISGAEVEIDTGSTLEMSLNLNNPTSYITAWSGVGQPITVNPRLGAWSVFRVPSSTVSFDFIVPIVGDGSLSIVPYVNTNQKVFGMSRTGTNFFSNQSHGGFVLFKNASIAQATVIRTALINMNSRR